jgi:hypothetical protein
MSTVTIPNASLPSSAFTPGLTFGGGSTGMTFSSRFGTWTKIGNLVLFSANLNLSAKGSSTGLARVTGLPATAATSLFNVTNLRVHALGAAPTAMGLWGDVDTNATTVQLCYLSAAGGESNFTDAHFGNTTSIFLSGFYFTP